ncbi:PREDICTED: uncharacterized protein LOC109162335 [Ipomoea nil]|uniref:uncharacterized protein LOC109162335 n=1 Tax=Ipomoea nil TaxID=35883 RepID=UPI000900A139|nr:PREDICTED: uncharacterized protein LOC109162335 [Ipomoea nil]
MGGKIDRSVNKNGGPPIFRINGQNFHYIGSLLPVDGKKPHFAQLYIYDTNNELSNRINSVRPDGEQNGIHVEIVNDIQEVLDTCNVLVKSFRMARSELQMNPLAEVKIKLLGKRSKDARTYNLPQVSEVAALIVGDIDTNIGERDIMVETKSGLLQRISELNPAYLPMQYPLLFPYGEDGYREDIPFSTLKGNTTGRQRISPQEYFAYRIMSRVSEVSTLLHSKRLFQQFLVDAYTMVESGRLIYIRTHQKSLRCESYNCLNDALTRGEVDPTTQGKRIILPSSFTGGARYMIQNYQDAMAICRLVGYPDLFITFTCNPKWPEVQRFLNDRKLKPEDRPDIICRLFKMKLDALISDCRKNKLFGPVMGVIYTIEFQKRGLPHAHILLFLDKINGTHSVEKLDHIISAELPDQEADAEYYKVVEEFMMHGPCGKARLTSPCMSNGKCTKHFPKKFVNCTTFDEDGYPIYRRRDNGRSVTRNGINLDNRYVVLHNRHLLLKYRAHINVEWCNQSCSIKYLFKYVNKGHDRVTAEFYRTSNDQDGPQVIDEINDDPVDNILSRPTILQSMFLEWFEANKTYPEARNLTYAEMPTKFVWKKDIRKWQPRKRGFSIGRVFYVPPGSGEIFYLRCLLNKVKGPTSYLDIQKVDGVQYESFRDACCARGLVDDDREYVHAIEEASHWATPVNLRRLFVTLLMTNSIAKPEVVWEAAWIHLSDDAQFKIRQELGIPDWIISEDEKKNFALTEIEIMLSAMGKSLKDFQGMPIPDLVNHSRTTNRLIQEELAYDVNVMKEENDTLVEKLTEEQRTIYDNVLQDAENNLGGLFFVYGYGGTGKTFLWRALSSALRSKGEIVLNVASSGIASLLLPGGRTAHSRFAIPIAVNEDSTCNISQSSPLAHLIMQCKLIIWDEAPMMHKFCFEALDRSMRDIMRAKNPNSFDMTFGGKTVVLGGDFRQILPVIPKGTRQDIVLASINSSYLWRSCKVFRLTKNLRLRALKSDSEVQEIADFAKWIANIGDGTIGDSMDGESEINIPE